MNSRTARIYLAMCFVVCVTFPSSTSGSLMRRIRPRQGSEVSENKGLDLETEDWIHVPPPIQDVLLSIDDKLRSLDTFSYTLKLARLDFSLDQLSRRMENIETKLGRLETKFDVRMEKVEEVVISKDIKEEFSNEHLSRRMENLNEKINSKATYLDAKLDMKLERIMGKLELLERDLHNSMDDILERLIKNDERYITAEKDALKREKSSDELLTNLLEMKVFLKDDFTNIVTSKSDEVHNKLDAIQTAVYVTSNQREKALGDFNRTITAIEGKVRESNNKLNNITTCNPTGRSQMTREIHNEETRRIPSSHLRQLNNLTTILEKRLQDGETKLQELDKDVELYTRKVVNGIQELWKTSDQLRSDLSTNLQQNNETYELVRREFRRLQEQIESLPTLEPKIMDMGDNIESKVSELSRTVDNSFATLLVAQNSFITSCRLIQEEEMHVYDILQQIVHEMRNRSTQDLTKIDKEIQRQGAKMQQSLAAIASAVTEAGDSTTKAVGTLRDQIAKGDKCGSSGSSSSSSTGALHLDTVYQLCRQIVIEPSTSNENVAQVVGNTAALKEIRQKILQALAEASNGQDYDQRVYDNQTDRQTRNTSKNSDYDMDYRISGLDYQ